MANINLTEIQTTSAVNSNAKVLITQPATGGTETVYRAAKDLIGKNYDSEISGLTTRVGTAESNITTLQNTTGTQTTNITNLQGRMTTAEGNITTHGTNISTLQTAVSNLQPKLTNIQIDSSTNSFTVTYADTSTKTWYYILDSEGKITSITDTQPTT